MSWWIKKRASDGRTHLILLDLPWFLLMPLIALLLAGILFWCFYR